MLFQYFLNNSALPTFKWFHYFPIYERFFSQFVNKSVRVLEIGVRGGGSLLMWRDYFGPRAKIVGIDIEPQAKKHESFGVNIEIGNQNDHNFLNGLIDKYGDFDIIIDDGSHKSIDIKASMEFFLPRMGPNSIYLIEDTHMGWAPINSTTDVDLFDFFSELVKEQSRHYIGPQSRQMSTNMWSINFYDSIIVIEFTEPFTRMAQSISMRREINIDALLRPGWI